MISCEWLPDIVPCKNLADYAMYEECLYKGIFIKDFVKSSLVFNNAIVEIRVYPKTDGKEEAFYHITCKDYTRKRDRVPDLRRAERVVWIKPILRNYELCNGCGKCNGIYVWKEPYKNTSRIYVFLVDERYIIILEPKKTYYLLITAFYVDRDDRYEDFIERYEKSKN